MPSERNQPCPCGSGKKYKKCHGKNVSKGPSIYKVKPRKRRFEDIPIPAMPARVVANAGMMALATMAAARRQAEKKGENTESTEGEKEQ